MIKGSVKTVTTKPALVPVEKEVEAPPKISDDELFNLKDVVKALIPPPDPAPMGPPEPEQMGPPAPEQMGPPEPKTLAPEKKIPKLQIPNYELNPPAQIGCGDDDHELLARYRHPNDKQDVLYCWSKTVVDEYYDHIKPPPYNPEGRETLSRRAIYRGTTGLVAYDGTFVLTEPPGQGHVFEHDDLIGYADTKEKAIELINADMGNISDEYDFYNGNMEGPLPGPMPEPIDEDPDINFADLMKTVNCLDDAKDKSVDRKTAEDHKKSSALECLDKLLKTLGYDNTFSSIMTEDKKTDNIATLALKHTLNNAVQKGWNDVAMHVIDTAKETQLDISKSIVDGAKQSLLSCDPSMFATCMENSVAGALPDVKQMGMDMIMKDGLTSINLKDPSSFGDIISKVQDVTGVTGSDIFDTTLSSGLVVDNLKNAVSLVNNKTAFSVVGSASNGVLNMFKAAGDYIYGKSGTSDEYDADITVFDPDFSQAMPPGGYAGADKPLDATMGKLAPEPPSAIFDTSSLQQNMGIC